MEAFSERLRNLRISKGMSQAEMAEAVGLARTGYAEIEHGVSVKTFKKLPYIAKALGCRIDDLFPEMDEVKTARTDGFEDDSLDDFEM